MRPLGAGRRPRPQAEIGMVVGAAKIAAVFKKSRRENVLIIKSISQPFDMKVAPAAPRAGWPTLPAVDLKTD